MRKSTGTISVWYRLAVILVAMVAVAAVAFPVAGAAIDDGSTGSDDEAGDGAPSVETAWADVLDDTALIVGAELADAGEADAADVWFEYRENGTDEWSTSETARAASQEAVTAELTELEPGTLYEYRAVAATEYGTDRGDVLTAATPNDRPAATTVAPRSVGEDRAEFAANVTDLGGEESAEVWFSYSPTDVDEPHSDWEETPAETVDETGEVSQVVDGLEPDTAYEYTAHIDNGERAGYSTGYVTFSTDAPFVVETGDATNVEEASATLTAEVEAFGGADSIAGWFEYRPVGADDWAETGATDADSAGQIVRAVSDLDPGTAYEYRVVAETNEGDADVGSVETFETLVDPVVETGEASDVGEESAVVSGTLVDLGGADEATVAIEYRASGDGEWDRAAERTMTEPASFAAELDGLDPDTTYEYRAVASAAGVEDAGATETVTTIVADHEPIVEELVGADVSGPNPHADLSVDWRVADEDGDLSAVEVTVRDGAGFVVAQEAVSVDGATERGSLSERVKHGAGETYEVTLTAEDEAGNVVTERTAVATSR